MVSADWSDYYTISGLTIANLTNRWTQYEVTFISRNNLNTPTLYDVTISWPQTNTLNVSVSTNRVRYVHWSHVTIYVDVTDGNVVSIQGANIDVTLYDTYERVIWTGSALSESGRAQFRYLLAFNAQMGNYRINTTATLIGYQQGSVQITFFSSG